ncbi:MAG: hypothetical protein IKD08_05695 [Alphaproteobacteria bacterium]|nr:hypothetical protein [Elusimicrobiaceae bacterium]MBR7159143.1 hypothetical protein [Alphaproteobacteria bacterium]
MPKKLLSELLLTRFTHDIAGGVGAITNGCELIAESMNDKDFLQEAVKVLNTSAQSVAARMRFYRLAFGSESSDFSAANASDITKKYIATLNRISLNWEPSGTEDYVLMRIMMILCLIAGTAVSRGGEITVYQDKVEASGKNAGLADNLADIFSGKPDFTPDSLNIAAVLVSEYAKDGGYSLQVEEGQDKITFWVR